MDKYAAVAITLLGAVFFVVGNIYLQAYYSKIGISPLEVDHSIQDVLAHSIVVIYSVAADKIILATGLFVVSMVFLLKSGHVLVPPRAVAVFSNSPFVLVGTALILASAAAMYLGVRARDLGKANAARDLRSAPKLWVDPKIAATGVLEPLNGTGAYLTFITADDTHIFAAIRYRDGNDYWIVRLSREDFGATRVFNDD